MPAVKTINQRRNRAPSPKVRRAKQATDVPAYMQPGYTFSIGWPPGYENGSPYAEPTASTTAALSAAGVKGGGATTKSQITEAMRRGELEQLPSGRGSLGVLSPRSASEVAKTERIRRSL